MMNNILKKNDFSMLGPMHTILAGLKALVCEQSYENLKTLREVCGEFGFTKMAGISRFMDNSSSFVTLEGDATVMYL